MTDQQHPINIPPDLEEELLGLWPQEALQRAAQWGADIELEACCEILRGEFNYHRLAELLRAARRHQPKNLAVDPLPSATPPQSGSRLPAVERKDGKINFRANERLISILSDLKQQKGMTMSESLRKGASLLHIAMQEQAKGRRLAFIDDEGKVVAEVHAIVERLQKLEGQGND